MDRGKGLGSYAGPILWVLLESLWLYVGSMSFWLARNLNHMLLMYLNSPSK